MLLPYSQGKSKKYCRRIFREHFDKNLKITAHLYCCFRRLLRSNIYKYSGVERTFFVETDFFQ